MSPPSELLKGLDYSEDASLRLAIILCLLYRIDFDHAASGPAFGLDQLGRTDLGLLYIAADLLQLERSKRLVALPGAKPPLLRDQSNRVTGFASNCGPKT